jgi:hypothetical protein
VAAPPAADAKPLDAATKGIDGKLRDKVKAAVAKKEVPAALVDAVEGALFEAAGGSVLGDRGKFKELTRLLAKCLDEDAGAKASLASGALAPAALVARVAAGN